MRETSLENHRAWLGLLQPVGLVVSPYALVQAQASIDQNLGDLPLRLNSLLKESADGSWLLPSANAAALFTELLQWRATDLLPVGEGDSAASMYLADYQETVAATYIVKDKPSDPEPLLLVSVRDDQSDFDAIAAEAGGWQVSPQAKFERLLREKGVPTGLLLGQHAVRLIYAPKGESSGYVTFPFHLMRTVAGRSVLAAFKMLLGTERLFSLPTKERLPALLAESRQYQNVVSTQLADQVLAALYDLLRGLQAADERTQGKLLQKVLESKPNDVYHASITTLMRMVFVLFAEDRGLIPAAEVYARSYSLKGLFERLREDDVKYHDTMDQRYGAWAQLLVLFRLLYDGIDASQVSIPARHGHLFDPRRFPFLEGRVSDVDSIDPPLIADGVLFRVLSNLMLLDGERISYRALDVEQIGSVYETVMGFQVEVATGVSVAIKPKKAHGAPVHVDLDELLKKSGADRKKYLKVIADQEVTGDALANATTIEALEAALDRKIARIATPHAVAKGSLILQPSDARRKSGSHYTPRSLTEPIVRKAIEPVLAGLGENPTPEQILELKVCDPAMGSGAFLVEATRQLSEVLVSAWHRHNCRPSFAADEDDLLHARRLVVQRCIYGVDKNPMAVDLAKLSLWLATFAKDHAFTFLDHALKAGDSLVGLSLDQISGLTWEPNPPRLVTDRAIREMVREYLAIREKIRTAREASSYDELVALNEKADAAVASIRSVADSIVATYFSFDTARARREKLDEVEVAASNLLAAKGVGRALVTLSSSLAAFHWELEFPEVFQRDNGGFDCIVGNPPFLGGTKISTMFGSSYLDWLLETNPQSHGNGDLVSHFFRKVYLNVRRGGALGLIASNTISQGDTRQSGLRWICANGGDIFSAWRRIKWPGQAAVLVSVVHVLRESKSLSHTLDGKSVETITAFLFHAGVNENPRKLSCNASTSFTGSKIYGQGFIFDDADSKGKATSLAEMRSIIEQSPNSATLVLPYIGGDEVYDSPKHLHDRYVIDFREMTKEQASEYTLLFDVVVKNVKPERATKAADVRKHPFWQFWRSRRDMYNAIGRQRRVLVTSCGATPHFAVTYLPTGMVYAHSLALFAMETNNAFAALQSRPHEVWARFFASSMKDDLRYTPSDCFETFPFPEKYESNANLESAGKEYYEFRAALMVQNNEGLTKTYNRFHDPNELSEGILKLRELHAKMDRAVLDAYGWTDITADCKFLLDFEDDDESETGGRRRRKPWRYRWPDEVRDEVLARLLDLNAKRAEAERLEGGASDDGPSKSKKKAQRKSKKSKDA